MSTEMIAYRERVIATVTAPEAEGRLRAAIALAIDPADIPVTDARAMLAQMRRATEGSGRPDFRGVVLATLRRHGRIHDGELAGMAEADVLALARARAQGIAAMEASRMPPMGDRR